MLIVKFDQKGTMGVKCIYIVHVFNKQCKAEVIAQLISVFVFATQIVQSLFFLHLKFRAAGLLLRLYRLVCVGPNGNLKLLVFSCTG